MASLPVRLMRGGTSKGVFLRKEALESTVASMRRGSDGISADNLLSALVTGSAPDASGLQLDGLGGGISSTSKVAVMSLSANRPKTVEYLFGQVHTTDGSISYASSCGNLAAAAGLFAVEDGLISLEDLETSTMLRNHWVVPVFHTNAGNLINVHVPKDPYNEPRDTWVAIGGVPGLAPPILVEFVNPSGPGGVPLFPTGNVVDQLKRKSGHSVFVSLVFTANPTIFIAASEFGMAGHELPDELDGSLLNEELVHMSDQLKQIVPGLPLEGARLAIIGASQTYFCTDGKRVDETQVDLVSRITTQDRIHHAHTLTGALNLAIASEVPGTIPFQAKSSSQSGLLRIGHPGGILETTAQVRQLENGSWQAERVGMVRTARTLFAGLAALPYSILPVQKSN